jgi:glycosyltransferase involved in cell wall biosynthesis
MKILIHAVSAHDMGGAARHLAGFLPELVRIGQDHEYLLYVNDRLPLDSLPLNYHVIRLPVQSALLRFWWDQFILPRLVKKEHVDLVLALLSFGSARPSCPQITFLRNPIHCPHYMLNLSVKQRLDVILRRYFLYRTLRASHLIIAPSAAIRDTVRHVHPDLPLDRFRILPHAFNREIFLLSEDLPLNVSNQLPEERSDDTIRLLYVGHILPYKGFRTVLEAIRLLAEQGINFKLYLTIARENWPSGFDKWVAEVSRLKLGDHVVILGRIPSKAISNLYQRCDILWFPSLCETFGWPIIEAMSCSLPIVASDTALNREMAGEAALYYPPFDAFAASQAITRLTLDSEERRRLGEIGQKRANAHIRWDQYVQTVLNYCKEVIS